MLETARLRRFARDDAGGITAPFAVALTALAMLVCGGVDMAALASQRAKMQDAADAAALAAAQQLGVANNAGVGERARAMATAHLVDVAREVDLTYASKVSDDKTQVTVTIRGRRDSYFANLLPVGGWKLSVAATGEQVGLAPLCVLSSSATMPNKLALADSSKLTAPGCLVQSNSDITAGGSSHLTAAIAQAAGSATGNISPAPQANAPEIPDPFASMKIKPLLPLCMPLDLIYPLGIHVLAPGVHCGRIRVKDGVTLKLLPGDHYFQGMLELSGSGVMTGRDVALIFDDTSQFSFRDTAQVDLEGRKSGVYAGFLILTTRKNTGTLTISSTNARRLLGAIYVPNATLAVSGSANKVADQSDWTVVIAKSISLQGSPNLVINTNYAGSPVPVPSNMPGAKGSRLSN